jgi:hypothetical protein
MERAGGNDSPASFCAGLARCVPEWCSSALRGAFMGEIITFRSKADLAEEAGDVDLLTAVDAAIRDLRDISERWGEEAARLQAEECRQMLERAFKASL